MLGKCSELAAFASYTAQSCGTPDSKEAPHPNSPSSPQTLESLTFFSLRISSETSGSTCCGRFDRGCLDGPFPFFIDNRSHCPYQAFVWPNRDDGLEFLVLRAGLKSGLSDVHLASA